MAVFLAQCLCPSRHCFLACAGLEPEVVNRFRAVVEGAWSCGVFNKKCEICGATEFQFEVRETCFQTMEEAQPYLEEVERQNLLTRQAVIDGRKAAKN